MSDFGIPNFISVDEYSLEFISKPDLKKSGEFAPVLGWLQEAGPFWAGDFLRHSEEAFGEAASQFNEEVADKQPRRYSTLANYKSICSRVLPAERRAGKAQSISHCSAVAKYSKAEQVKWLKRSRDNDWTVAQLRAELDAKEVAVEFDAQSVEETANAKFAAKMRKEIIHISSLQDGAPTPFQSDLLGQAVDLLQEAKRESEKPGEAAAEESGDAFPAETVNA